MAIPLHRAVQSNDVDEVRKLLESDECDVNCTDSKLWTPLHHACAQGNVSLVEILIREYNADVNARNDKSDTPLCVAASKGKEEVALALIKEFGCDTNVKGFLGRSLLHRACEGGSVGLVRTLLHEHNADVNVRDDLNDTPLHVAAVMGKEEIALVLIKEFGYDPNIKGHIGSSLLHSACEGGSVGLVRTLILEHNADVNARDDENNTPLHVAAAIGDPNMKGKLDRPLLHQACEGGSVSLVRTLILEYNADVNVRDDQNDTPLHVAAYIGNEEVALVLIKEFGCDPNVKGQFGRSLLHQACEGGSVGLVRTLILEHNADVNALDDNNRTPLDLATSCREEEIASVLINEFGCNKDTEGKSNSLHVEMNSPDVTFHGDPKETTISTSSVVINMSNVGISLSIPEEALDPVESQLTLSVRPCLTGPFELPPDYEAVSPAYLIRPRGNGKLRKDVSVRIQHCSSLQSEEDCEDLAFLSASSTPEYRGSSPVYPFREVEEAKGVFKVGDQEGEIALKSLQLMRVAKRVRTSSIKSLMCTVRLLRTVKEDAFFQAIFVAHLDHPIYSKRCERAIAGLHPGGSNKGEATSAVITAKMVSEDMILKTENATEWDVNFDPVNRISRKSILFPEGVDANLLGYPPMIAISGEKTSSTSAGSPKLLVIGLDRECSFNLITIPDNPDNEAGMKEFIEGVQNAIAKSGKIDRKLAHSMFVGPTGSGKSSLMDRLLGRRRKKFSASTGVCDTIVIVDINVTNPSTFHPVTILEGDTWEEIECDVSYVRQLGQESVNVKNPPKNPQKPKEKSAHTHASARPDPAMKVGSVRVAQPHSKRKDAPVPLLRRKLKDGTIISSENINSVIKKYGFRKVKKYLKKTCSLYLRDTGGQVEFQEMLPLLIFGPSIFFFIFRLDLDFKSKFCVKYRMSANKSINCYTSSITTEEALLQCLASVYAMDMSEEQSVKTHKPMVFIVGTHKDRLGSEVEGINKIDDLNRHLDFITRSNGFRDLVQYAGDGHDVMFAVDNTSDSEEDFQKIRSKVNHLINVRKWFSIEYPISYLLFCLDLQNIKQSILTLDECKVLAAQHGIEGDQVSHLLRFLHIRIGVIRYFNIEGLKHIVVKEPQVLFDMITDLLVKTFSCESVTTREAFDFKKKGILSASAFEDVVSSDDKISPKEFLQLLVHLRIITPFTTSEDQEERYFIPCVLNHVPESPDEDSITTDILPLLFKFKSDHCPKGIFGVLSTHLMTPERGESEEVVFILIHDKIFKDQVSFEVHSSCDQDEMSLKVYSSHLEVKFFPFSSDNDRDTPLKGVCNNVRQILEKSILRSLKNLHYSNTKLEPMACFKCEHCTQMHPVKPGRTHHKIHCNKARKGSRIPLNGRCWYNEDCEPPTTSSVSSPLPCSPPQPTPRGPHPLTMDDHHQVTRFLADLSNDQLVELGAELGLRYPHLQRMKVLPADMVAAWLREEDRVTQISGTPSWNSLATALRAIGQTGTASRIKDGSFM